MPTNARGTHAFRPSQQTFGAVANQSGPSGQSSPGPAATPSTAKDMNHQTIDNEQSLCDSIAHETMDAPPSVRPPPSIASVPNSINSFNSRQSKRKHSALGEEDSPAVSATSSEKRQRASGSSALVALQRQMDQMSARFTTSMDSDAIQHAAARESRHRDRSPQRRARAGARMQKLEKGLTNDQMVALLDLFETNTASADMYLSLEEDNAGLRWAWISNKLKQMGHPSLPPRDIAEDLVQMDKD